MSWEDILKGPKWRAAKKEVADLEGKLKTAQHKMSQAARAENVNVSRAGNTQQSASKPAARPVLQPAEKTPASKPADDEWDEKTMGPKDKPYTEKEKAWQKKVQAESKKPEPEPEKSIWGISGKGPFAPTPKRLRPTGKKNFLGRPKTQLQEQVDGKWKDKKTWGQRHKEGWKNLLGLTDQAREDRTQAREDKRKEYEKDKARDKAEGKQRFKDLATETRDKRTVKPGSAIAEYQRATAQKETDTKQRMGEVADRYQYEGARDEALAQVEADKTAGQTRDKQLARGQSKALQAARKKLGLSRHVGETDAELLQRIKSHGKPKPPQPPQQTGPTDEELQQMYSQSPNARLTYEQIKARKKKVQAPKGPTGPPPPNQKTEIEQANENLKHTTQIADEATKKLGEAAQKLGDNKSVIKMNNDKYNAKQKGEKNRNLTPFVMPQKERPAPKTSDIPGVVQHPKRRQKKTENKW